MVEHLLCRQLTGPSVHPIVVVVVLRRRPFLRWLVQANLSPTAFPSNLFHSGICPPTDKRPRTKDDDDEDGSISHAPTPTPQLSIHFIVLVAKRSSA
jgi:hypothetical protein